MREHGLLTIPLPLSLVTCVSEPWFLIVAILHVKYLKGGSLPPLVLSMEGIKSYRVQDDDQDALPSMTFRHHENVHPKYICACISST